MIPSQRCINAIKTVIKNEGGYVNHPCDPGGETKYGISKRTYPHLDIRNLTIEDAITIYKKNWWGKYRFEDLPLGIGEKIFDLAVNMGPKRAFKILQQALCDSGQKVDVDGILGSKTRWACQFCFPQALLEKIKYRAREWYELLAVRQPKMEIFLKGWLRRLER